MSGMSKIVSPCYFIATRGKWVNMNIQIIILSLTPSPVSPLVDIVYNITSLPRSATNNWAYHAYWDCFLYTYCFSHTFKSYFSIWHLVSESFSLQQSFHFILLFWKFLQSDIIPGESQWPASKPFGDIPSICPQPNTPILVYFRLQ